jgi:pyruvate-ferredoxin/flavodoxin oxidoreductase
MKPSGAAAISSSSARNGLCVEICPAKEKALVMRSYEEQKEQAMNWAFAMTLRQKENPAKKFSVKGVSPQPAHAPENSSNGCSN